MLTAILLAVVCAFVLVIALLIPLPGWNDDTDCSGIIQHSVRVLSDLERETMWRARFWLWLEYGDKFQERLPLQPPK